MNSPARSMHRRRRPPRDSRGPQRQLWLAMAVYVFYAIAWESIWCSFSLFGVDFDKHWYAAVAILEGKSVYLGNPLWMGFNYPQASAFMFAWLGWFDVITAQWVFKGTMLGAILLTILVAARSFRPAPVRNLKGRELERIVRTWILEHWWLTCAFSVTAFLPLVFRLQVGNIDPLIVLFGTAMMAACLRGYPRLGGVFWALFTLIKMMPVVLLGPVVLWGRWRVLQGFLAAMAVYGAVLLATGRLADEWFFARVLVPLIPAWWREISIAPFRLIAYYSDFYEWYRHPYGFMIGTRICTGVLLSTFLVLLVLMRRRGANWLRALEMGILFGPILSPLLEAYHLAWVLPTLLMQIHRWVKADMRPWAAPLLLSGWIIMFVSFIIYIHFSLLGTWTHTLVLLAYLYTIGATACEALAAHPLNRRTVDS